jgi:hypothetical protein
MLLCTCPHTIRYVPEDLCICPHAAAYAPCLLPYDLCLMPYVLCRYIREHMLLLMRPDTTRCNIRSYHCILRTIHYILHTTHYILHTTNYTIHTTYYILHTFIRVDMAYANVLLGDYQGTCRRTCTTRSAVPYALCLMPYALCLMPYAVCLVRVGGGARLALQPLMPYA